MKLRTVFVLAAIAATTAGCTAAGSSGSKALPAGSAKFPTPTVTTAPIPVPVHAIAAPAPVIVTTTTTAPAAKSCDVVREALLTGTPAEIAASMSRLVADRSAPVDAREAARSYLNPASYASLNSELVASVHKSWGDLVAMDCS